MALFGVYCVLEPLVQKHLKRTRGEAAEPAEKRKSIKEEATVAVVVVDTPPKVEGDLQTVPLEVEAKQPPVDAAKPARRKMAYLTNVKTFLTFIVVTFHITIQFSFDGADGIGTLNVQLADLSNPSSSN